MTALATRGFYRSENTFDETNTASRSMYSEVVTYSWQAAARDKLRQLERLSDNWNSYGSIPPTRTVLHIAKVLLFDLLDDREMPVLDISPIHDGGIQIEWHKGIREFELEVFPDGHFEFLKIENDEHLEEGPASLSKVNSLISWVLHE